MILEPTIYSGVAKVIAETLKTNYKVIIEYYPFELRPEPVPTLEPLGEYLLTTWSRSVYPMGKHYGMFIRLPSVQPRFLLTSVSGLIDLMPLHIRESRKRPC